MGEINLVFYADDGSRIRKEHERVQDALSVMVAMNCRMGLEANIKKTKPMVCTPRFIWGIGEGCHIIDGKQGR